ncbi:probable mannan synthase 4 isoform X1 [Ananas comosus]|uniref:glucomannan 4-beta-mannosyltransferase n=2 Tax=Ananas comosus TaxID=4615 RepID=A0A6P5GEI0_ANACO|nr:probable mannan synthase 4 isoform X1 [Ananas comosus]
MAQWRAVTLAMVVVVLCSSAAAAAYAAAGESNGESNGVYLGSLLDQPILLPSSDLVANASRLLQQSIARCVESIYRSLDEVSLDRVGVIWREVRSRAIAPVLSVAVALCMVMSFMLVFEAAYMSAVSLGVKLLRRKPEKMYKWEPIEGDEEKGSLAFPMVLVQIPMYNEKEVYKLSIRAACALTWPPDRIIIQVLDDSTDPLIKDMVELECKAWASKQINIKYEVRSNRKGYKAGALKKGMEHYYAQQCDFVAIFDADFQPQSDFLMRTIPFLLHNPKIALVQARWEFGMQVLTNITTISVLQMLLTWPFPGDFAVNYDVCLMTRIQKISLDYHFKVEQESGSSTYAFFGFNGTAGVWRMSAINEAGGWKDRTTVEDMDLAVRATLKGWKLLYDGDITVKSELPSTFKAYRHQQHRWTCGAANLFRKMAWNIAINKEVSLWKKLHVLYSFFFVRRVIAPLVTFTFYCIVIPISSLVPEVSIPIWGLFYIPTAITILNAIRNPRSLHIMPFWILFENVMSMLRMKAAIVGVLETASVNEWVVTEKVGDNNDEKADITEIEPDPIECKERVYFPELGLAVFLLLCATYNLAYCIDYHYVYIYLQATAFIIVGFGLVGTLVSNS